MQTIYIGLGSNLDAREDNLRHALALLAPEIVVQKVSPVYETVPMYVEQQPKFLNAVCAATTDLSAKEVLHKLQTIEKTIGKHEHNQPRLVDLDILFDGSLTTVISGLTIPHPRIAERAFVLAPMVDIAGDFVHPVLGCTMAELLSRLGDYSHLAWKTNIAL